MTRWSDDAARAVLSAGLRRREFLDLIALVAVLPGCKERKRSEPVPAQHDHANDHAPRSLDAAASRALDAAAARILPADGSFPGASEAGVIDFIDRQLALPPLTKVAPALIALAHAFDDGARARNARDFASLPGAQQDAVLDVVSRGALGTKLPEALLFRVLHALVLEGFLSDPHHGGNKEQVGWRAIGFTEPALRTRGHGHDHGG